ncbi:MAG: ATP-binding cassette domain-containing protein, partial [Thermodesulfobacteriota bacterium]
GGGGWRRFSEADRLAAREALERVGMWEHPRRLITELSGGQRQRVLLARALVAGPKLLCLDEPTASVDTRAQSDFYELLRELNRTVTIVIVSHDLMVLSSYIKSVACVNRQVHFHDRPELTKDMIQMAYHCPVELLAHGVPHRVVHLHEDE